MEAAAVSFEKEVIEASHSVPVLVDFWAEWCGPCRVLGPVLEKLAQQASGQWRLVKINVDEHPEAAQAYRVQGIPAVKLIFKGEVIGEFVGALPEPAVLKWLRENLPSESKAVLTAAREAFEKKDLDRARDLAEKAVAGDPDNQDARVLLARLLFASYPEKAVALVENVAQDHPEYDRAEAMRTLGRLLGGPESGTDADDPRWQDYLAGADALKKAAYDRALEYWIGMLEKGVRDVDDDGPRKACIAVFHFLGEDHEITQAYRRKFSSALY